MAHPDRSDLFEVQITENRRLTDSVFEIRFSRPDGFDFLPGQNISIRKDNLLRDYSLIGSRQDSDLSICLRNVPHGALSPRIANARKGDRIHISPAFGHFLFQSWGRTPVFIATGTGIAPFVSYVRSGVTGYLLLHGVRSEEDLYYRAIISGSASTYAPCISAPELSATGAETYFRGHVTDFLKLQLPRKSWDFYLCGRSEMIRDATIIIDQYFEGSRVFSEVFY
jgi:ferredoxin-NADP reductase